MLATISQEPLTIGGISREARLYGVRELVRRAGVSEELFRSWRIDLQADWTNIYVAAGTRKCLRFRNSASALEGPSPPQTVEVARAAWADSPKEPVRRLVPHFIIPFSGEESDPKLPLFRQVNADCVECHFDLPLSTLLVLCRFEEYGATERDEHGRFSAARSLAFRGGFLTRPVVDELGLALEQALIRLLTDWQPSPRRLRVKLSHDIDQIGLPFKLRTVIGHTLQRSKPSATIRDLFAAATECKPAYLALVQAIAQMSLDRGLDSAVYWKAALPGPYDTGYNLRQPKVRQVIAWLNAQHVECGVHPGYETFCRPDRLLSEVQVVREAIGKELIGGRQHYLRWNPETWLDWEACRLAYDSSVGFADQVGFRAGTCIPYRPWVLSANREARLLEIPLIMMDCTPVAYMGLPSEKTLAVVEECVSRCRLVGGVFTLLWHNSSLMDTSYGDLYPAILDRLTGADRFDWSAALREWQSPESV
jgi:uncharacterized protein DUF7033